MNSENSLYKVKPKTTFQKKISLPASKSHANRALIVGALRGGDFKIHNLPDSTDVLNLVSCLREIGLEIIQDHSTFTFKNSFPQCESKTSFDIIDLYTGDGGTTNRFLLALLARGKKSYQLFPSEKMSERPIDDLLEPLKSLAVKITTSYNKNEPWITIRGPATMINTSRVAIDCHKSTQFASAMMLAFSTLPLTLDFKNLDASATYLELTEYVLKETLNSNSYTIPVDFSSLSYPAALAAVCGDLVVSNCFKKDTFQPDSFFIDFLEQVGAVVSWSPEGLKISKGQLLKPFSLSIKNFPDLFPTLVYLAAHCEGVSELSELEILRYKESDRLAEMLKVLDAFKVKYEFNQELNILTIHGQTDTKYAFAEIHPPRDHRIVMASYLFMRTNLGGDLYEANCVEKSFPRFFSQLE
jgi:3-phosphoshikimate 1-carboxyvinyltransferase